MKPGDSVLGAGGYGPPRKGFVPDECLGETGEVAYMERVDD